MQDIQQVLINIGKSDRFRLKDIPYHYFILFLHIVAKLLMDWIGAQIHLVIIPIQRYFINTTIKGQRISTMIYSYRPTIGDPFHIQKIAKVDLICNSLMVVEICQ